MAIDKYERRIWIAVGFVASFVLFGTIFFHFVEGWSYVDSFYFTGCTITTVGFGDIVPKTAFGRISTVFFAFSGISVIAYSLSMLAQRYFEHQEQRLHEVWTDRGHPVRQVARKMNEMAEDAGVHELASGAATFARKFAERKGLKKKTEFVPIESISRWRMRR